jgi:hypothetical protein
MNHYGGHTMSQQSAIKAQGMCECGHPLAEHAESGWGPHTVCVEALPTFPDGGWYGVCPCVRHDDAEFSEAA